LYLLESTQQELAEAARLLDLTDHRFDDPFLYAPDPANSHLKAIQSWVPKTGVFSVSDLRGFFHDEGGANDNTRNRRTRARAAMTVAPFAARLEQLLLRSTTVEVQPSRAGEIGSTLHKAAPSSRSRGTRNALTLRESEA
jgi:hypothetical protein